VKRVLLDRLPYAVIFFVEEDTVYVVAVEAFRRRPQDIGVRVSARGKTHVSAFCVVAA
jgi:hypothetical protein